MCAYEVQVDEEGEGVGAGGREGTSDWWLEVIAQGLGTAETYQRGPERLG